MTRRNTSWTCLWTVPPNWNFNHACSIRSWTKKVSYEIRLLVQLAQHLIFGSDSQKSRSEDFYICKEMHQRIHLGTSTWGTDSLFLFYQWLLSWRITVVRTIDVVKGTHWNYVERSSHSLHSMWREERIYKLWRVRMNQHILCHSSASEVYTSPNKTARTM